MLVMNGGVGHIFMICFRTVSIRTAYKSSHCNIQAEVGLSCKFLEEAFQLCKSLSLKIFWNGEKELVKYHERGNERNGRHIQGGELL